MKQNLTFPLTAAVLAAFASPVFAGDIDVVITGTVQFSQAGTATPAPLAGLVQDDVVSIKTSVFAPGTPGQLSGTSYDVDPSASSLTTPLGVIPADTAAAAGTVEIIDGVFDPMMGTDLRDLIVSSQAFAGGVTADSAAAWIESWFPNEDLASQVGTTYDLTFAGNADILGITISDASGGYFFLRITEVEISAAGLRLMQTKYCPAEANSTGIAARINAVGSTVVQDNALTLSCDYLPINSFGFYLVGTDRALVAAPGGSQGTLCLGGQIGRFVRPGEIMNSGLAGTVSIDLSLSDLPSPSGSMAAQAGQTMQFSYWYRDVNPVATSNFADAVEISFE